MIYSDFHGLKLSRRGFGCMRFITDAETGEVDQNRVNNMFDLAIENGVNYIDSTFGSFLTERVKAFQTEKGLKPDGIVGPLTWGELLKTKSL